MDEYPQRRGFGLEQSGIRPFTEPLSIPETVSQQDVDLALFVHQKVMEQLGPKDSLKPYIFQKFTYGKLSKVAASIKRNRHSVRRETMLLRRLHWRLFRAEVARLVVKADGDEEARYLYELLFRNGLV